MTKAELVAKIAEGAGITKVQAEKALATFTCAVSCALRVKEKVTLVGFGTFTGVVKGVVAFFKLPPLRLPDDRDSIFSG